MLKSRSWKIKAERLLLGVALLAAFLLIASLVSSFEMAQRNFSPETVFWARLILGLGSGVILLGFILRPLLRSRSVRQIARFLEERHPELQDRLSTAVEIGSPGSKIHPELRELVSSDAFQQFRRIPVPRFYWPRLSQGSIIAFAVSFLVFLALFFSGPDAYRYSLGKLAGDWGDQAVPPLYQVVVTPGNAVVGERADLEVSARVVGFVPEEVRLFALYDLSSNWDSTPMTPPRDDEGYTFHFYDIRERLQYYVDADGVRSETFTIDVAEMPRVEKVRVTLRFPPYVGLSDAVLEDETRITALQGTRATVRVETDLPAASASLRFDSGEDVEMERAGELAFEGAFDIARDDYFRVFLENSEGVVSPASSEFSVEVLEDLKPSLRFTRPGRDRRVTNIEEVFAELRAEDDYGILGLSLVYSVNGGEETEIRLPFTRGSRQASANHIFYLEEFEVVPGDFVSYYAKASDAITSSASDIFFLEVEPFDRAFFQSQQSGGQQGGQQDGLDLSRQQKQVVVGTFSLIQERDDLTESEFDENAQTLAMIQQRLQGQAQTIIDRLERRAGALADPKFTRMAEELKQAISHMDPAAKLLVDRKLEEALPEEQKALQSLLRAEALFTDVQVAMSESGEGGASPEDLADLVDLELDRTKNQYETIQQNRQAERDQNLDEALEKLKELARRQEQEMERQRRQAMASSNGRGSQNQMAEELERLARELKRLSREEREQQLSRASSELERAARELRAASSSGQGQQQANELARQALERMKQAEDRLSRQQRQEVQQNFEELETRAQQLRDVEQEVMEQMSQMGIPKEDDQDGINRFYQQMRELFWQKQQQQQDLQELEGKLHSSSRRIEPEEPQASRKLKQAANSIRDKRLPDMMRESSDLLAGGLANLAGRREERVVEELDTLLEQIREARRSLGAPGQPAEDDKLRRALEEAGQLGEDLEAMRRQAEERMGQGSEPARDGQDSNQVNGTEGRQEQSGDERSGQGQPGEGRSGEERSGQQAGRRDGQTPEGQPSGEESRQQGWQPGDEQGESQGERYQVGGPGGRSLQPGQRRGEGSRGIDPARAQREWRERVQQARELEGLVRGNRELSRRAAELVRQMEGLSPEGVYNDEAEVARLKAMVIDGLHQLELEISRQLRDKEGEYIRQVIESEVPPEYRDRVAEYYRKLAERRKE